MYSFGPLLFVGFGFTMSGKGFSAESPKGLANFPGLTTALSATGAPVANGSAAGSADRKRESARERESEREVGEGG